MSAGINYTVTPSHEVSIKQMQLYRYTSCSLSAKQKCGVHRHKFPRLFFIIWKVKPVFSRRDTNMIVLN